MSNFHGLIDGDIILYECIAGKDDEVLADLCYSISTRVKTLVEDCGVDTYDIFLSGPREVNYRYEVYPEYKAKRPPKPAHFEGARQYMFDKLGAIEGTIGENDDQLGCYGFAAFKKALERWQEADTDDPEEMRWFSTTVIMTTDKDLKMIPGWHYSWSPKSDHDWHWIKLDQGFEWFFTQLLTGDKSTDNIPGLKGVGPKAAEKVMAVSKNNKERLENVTAKYVAKGHGLDYMLMNADLLWIQRDDRRGREFIDQLATQTGFDLAGAFPQPEPEPEPESNEEPEPSTKQEAKPKSAAAAFANRKPGKAAAAFAKRAEPKPKTQEAGADEPTEQAAGKSGPEDASKPAESEVESQPEASSEVMPGSSEEDLKEGIEGEYIPAGEPGFGEIPEGMVAKAGEEVVVDHDPQVTTYPDGTSFEFDDAIPF